MTIAETHNHILTCISSLLASSKARRSRLPIRAASTSGAAATIRAVESRLYRSMIVLLAAAAWLFAVSPLPAHAQDHVKFGWAKVLAGPAVSGLQQFASKYNLTIDLQEFKRFPDIRTALTTDSVDIGMLGAQEVPLVLSQGVTNLVVISGIDVGGTGVVARKGVTIAQWKDLYGKHIAAGQGGSAWTQFVAATTENGIDYSKLDMYNIVGGGFDHVRALERGDADAVVSWEPYMAAAVVRGVGTYVPLSIIDTKAAGAQVTVIVASKKFASEHPDLVVKVVKSTHRVYGLPADQT